MIIGLLCACMEAYTRIMKSVFGTQQSGLYGVLTEVSFIEGCLTSGVAFMRGSTVRIIMCKVM